MCRCFKKKRKVWCVNMLNAKIIGVGAAGNKAAIHLIEKGLFNRESVLLLNSTLRDVPEQYKDNAIEFGTVRGCGKERDTAKQMIMQSLHDKEVDLDTFIQPSDQLVVIVTSVEGGTGCGASSVLAQYIDQVLGKNVHMFALCGFEEDVRGLKNTVEWFNDLSEKYVVEAISNKKFLGPDKNRAKAEEAANEEFANRIGILIGSEITPSSSNMDDRDLFKVATTPGFMTIETCHLGKLKDQEQFNALLQTMIDDSKSLETEQSAKRFGIVINTSDKALAAIDESFDVLIKSYGRPFELFKHYQNVHDDDYINIIISGMKIPVDTIKGVYNKFKEQFDQVDKSKDNFFNRRDFNTDEGDIFNTSVGSTSADEIKRRSASFFKGFDSPKPVESNSSFKNTNINEL